MYVCILNAFSLFLLALLELLQCTARFQVSVIEEHTWDNVFHDVSSVHARALQVRQPRFTIYHCALRLTQTPGSGF